MNEVFLFPGQGSQYVGMGSQWHRASKEARLLYQRADEVLAYPLAELCFHGPEGRLNDTRYTQPAIFVTSLAMWAAVRDRYPSPRFVMGHSLGEFTALVAAGALSFEEGLRLVARRGQLMAEVGARHPGGMVALLGATPEAAEALCAAVTEQTGAVLVIANDNCPGQIVLSGEEAALQAAIAQAREHGVRRVRRLRVSIAPHSPLMEEARLAFAPVLEQTPLRPPEIPIILNATAEPEQDPSAIRQAMLRQLTSPVRWREGLLTAAARGGEHFVEIGPKAVLSGLVKRTLSGVSFEAVDRP